MLEAEEIMQTIERLQTVLADLALRGLRATGPRQLSGLRAIREEFERIGADHLAGRIAALADSLQTKDRGAAAALLRAQTSLRLFERVLTLEVAAESLTGLLKKDGSSDAAEEES